MARESLTVRLAGKSRSPREYSVRLLTVRPSARKVVEGSQAILDDPFQTAGLYGVGARKLVLPPLGEGSFRNLIDFRDESNILPQTIAALVQNVDGFGHRLELEDKTEERERRRAPVRDPEKDRLEGWFKYCYSEGSMVDLRTKMRTDAETLGIGYWETWRDEKGVPKGLNYVPAWTVRMAPYDRVKVVIEEQRRSGGWSETVKVGKHFRTYLQIVVAAGRIQKTWFKEFGDPRMLDAVSGEWIKTGKPERGQRPATELIPFRTGVGHAVTPYSLPRWIGNLPSVLGSRAAEEVNILYFDNKTIPPLVITVAGGRLTRGALKRVEDMLEHEIKGRENFHRALILEAMNPDAGAGKGTSQRPQIEIKPLTDKMVSDALFMGYDDANRNKLRGSFRLPPILIGETVDYNRATSESAILMAEEQVFRPERLRFDFWVNRSLMPLLANTKYEFKSLGPNVTQNEDLVSLLPAAEAAGGMTPNIARRIMGDIMEDEFPPIEEPWGDLPFALKQSEDALALVQAQLEVQLGGPAASGTPRGEDEELPAKRPPADPDAAEKYWRAMAMRLPIEVKRQIVLEFKAALRAEFRKHPVHLGVVRGAKGGAR